jgi:hypothetical protein
MQMATCNYGKKIAKLVSDHRQQLTAVINISQSIMIFQRPDFGDHYLAELFGANIAFSIAHSSIISDSIKV